MRIGHCQLESKTGDFEANLAKVVKGLERADRDRVEIVSFPECFLTG
ncbi:MAG TPA: nitrilase-related carbon-nitrogen hydrolase, partial [Gemmataceae bacterium]|nr:nitrilase-related carbon-nitrogen hydrolase [Gemmataceae bacterium]